MNRYLVISADTHAGLPGPGVPRAGSTPSTASGSTRSSSSGRGPPRWPRPGSSTRSSPRRGTRRTRKACAAAGTRPARDKELDADGVAGEVIFPDADSVSGGASAPFGAGLGASGDTPGELLFAGARAHNRWLAELCQDSPERRAGVAIVPIMVDVDAAVAEIRRAHASGLRGGILIPPMWQPHEPYHHPRYDPVWAVCEELSMPVHIHSGVADRASYGPHVGIFTTETRFWSSRPLPFLIWSGVFERFPGLRFGVAECGAFWVSDLLWRMDLVYERDHGSRKLGEQLTANMTMSPSEYFDRNCFIGASNIIRVEMARRYEIGVGNLCWGNDFPHPEGTWPHTREFLAPSVLRHPDRRDGGHPRGQRGRGLRLRHRGAGAARRSHRADARGARPGPTTRPPSGPTPSGPADRGSPASRPGPPPPRRRDHDDRSRRRSTRSTRPSSSRPTSRTPGCATRTRSTGRSCCRGWVVTRFDDVGRDPARPVDVERHPQGHAQPADRAWRSTAWPSTARPRRRSCTSTIPTTPGCASSWPSRSGCGR